MDPANAGTDFAFINVTTTGPCLVQVGGRWVCPSRPAPTSLPRCSCRTSATLPPPCMCRLCSTLCPSARRSSPPLSGGVITAAAAAATEVAFASPPPSTVAFPVQCLHLMAEGLRLPACTGRLSGLHSHAKCVPITTALPALIARARCYSPLMSSCVSRCAAGADRLFHGQCWCTNRLPSSGSLLCQGRCPGSHPVAGACLGCIAREQRRARLGPQHTPAPMRRRD